MAAAALTAVSEKEIRLGNLSCKLVKGLLTTTADWYDTSFQRIYCVICTPADAEAVGVTVSGQRVVIAKTTSAVVNLKIWGV